MERIKLIVAALTFALCSSYFYAQPKLNLVDKTLNFGFRSAQKRTIDVLIIHSTFNTSGGDYYDLNLVIKQFKKYYVSAHYAIGRNGEIYRLVAEKNIAFHAGNSSLPDGTTGINKRSIGIELLNSFDDSPSENQLISLTNLVKDIAKREDIKYILRHSDIAPGRKTDPWNFDWEGFLQRLKQ
ncbi:MAG: hypothetical protein AUK44_07525 [Porphyromonadaceae bacterium CG2_30_38_12]|nr:MAG: hypothetical protein AUK44_07525 [Porphyromonadaceae bacterium CG2_30_38_12]